MIIDNKNVKWDEYIQKLPKNKQDIYYTKLYYELSKMGTDGQALLFLYEKNNHLAIYPFIKRAIINFELDKTYYDIETAYGYGGPISNTDDELFLKEFENAFLEYCFNERIVAEFIRFHPLLKNEHIFKINIEVIHNRTTVWLDLQKSIDDIWMHEISKQNRNTIRKCIKNGLTVEISHDYDEFMEIYNKTMMKVGAEKFYYFQKDYYNKICNHHNYVLLRARNQKETIAAAIFMAYGKYFHYHLAGSRKEALQLAPNNILLWEAINYAKNHSYEKMHLGGGLTDCMEDNLFRFKSRFSTEYADFYIGKRIHNAEIYNYLMNTWEKRNNKKATLLLQYRE